MPRPSDVPPSSMTTVLTPHLDAVFGASSQAAQSITASTKSASHTTSSFSSGASSSRPWQRGHPTPLLATIATILICRLSTVPRRPGSQRWPRFPRSPAPACRLGSQRWPRREPTAWYRNDGHDCHGGPPPRPPPAVTVWDRRPSPPPGFATIAGGRRTSPPPGIATMATISTVAAREHRGSHGVKLTRLV